MPRAVFRVSPLMVLFALALGVCAIPVAFGAPYLWLIYLVPLGIVAWTLRTRTVVDAEGMRVRRLVGGRRVSWDEVGGLRVDRRNTVHAVLTVAARSRCRRCTCGTCPRWRRRAAAGSRPRRRPSE